MFKYCGKWFLMEGFVCQVDLLVIDKTLVTVKIIKIYLGNHLMKVNPRRYIALEAFA